MGGVGEEVAAISALGSADFWKSRAAPNPLTTCCIAGKILVARGGGGDDARLSIISGPGACLSCTYN